MQLLRLLLAALFSAVISAQNTQVTVHAAIVYLRTGERTPLIQSTTSTNTVRLTPLGASQAYEAGAFLHARYTNGGTISPISNLSAYMIDPTQLYVLAADYQYTVASAEAFMQGFYMPRNASSGEPTLDPAGMMSNGTYVESPLGGYQYPWIRAASGNDPNSAFVDGATNCPAWSDAANALQTTSGFQTAQSQSQTLYNQVAQLLGDASLPAGEYTYQNAYKIYDYLSYQFNHNVSFLDLLNSTTSPLASSHPTDYQQMQYLSDAYVQSMYSSSATQVNQISTVAGASLAGQILNLMWDNVQTEGNIAKFSLLVGDFAPLTSFFALSQLDQFDANFIGLPDYASTLVFELFSYPNATNITDSYNGYTVSYPTSDELYVRVLYRNGTATGQGAAPSLVLYPLFGTNEWALTWDDFQIQMGNFAMESPGNWCESCNAWQDAQFCLFYNDSVWSNLSSSNSSKAPITPVIAGVIGALSALAFVLLALVAVMILGRVRFTRASPRSGLGGFKGGQKMASDQDLTLDKSGVGVSVVGGGLQEEPKLHERVGSWELKDNAGNSQTLSQTLAASQGTQHQNHGEETVRAVSPLSMNRNSYDRDDGASQLEGHVPVKPRDSF